MVGFGSSLRRARRSGWEGAYLDYETLKLLLSQIEAVYEEEGHWQMRNRDILEGDSTERSRKNGPRDYRDELFLESDSDVAYASSASDVLGPAFASSGDEDIRMALNHPLPTISPIVDIPGKAKPFSLSYSQEASSADDDDESGDVDRYGVVSMSLHWVRSADKSESLRKKMQTKKKDRMAASRRADSEFFVRGGPDTFLIDGNRNDDDDDDDDELHDFRQSAMAPPSSLFQAPVHLSGNNNNEQTALLGRQAMTPPQNFYYGKDHVVTPPRNNSQNSNMGSNSLLPQPTTPFNNRSPAAPNNNHMSKWEAERKRQRRQRRLRRKRELEKKVPRHIRVAHSKARAITERFLGLLRAEVEKCTLFAQARLGELADTAGSLRFPFFEDNNDFGYFGSHGNMRSAAAAYEHPLSDGGMHPSASSSDDEGGVCGGQGLFPWSDSSDDDSSSNANKSSSIVSTGSGGGAISNQADATLHSNRDQKGKSHFSHGGGKHEGLDAAQRQIAHFEELRRNQPIFQRNDRIVGEDLLLLSAVDEADGYTAVGVELLHVLRYICLNMIAVRKICRKHDRLLMNRMLGGYYRRKHQFIRGGGITPGSTTAKELQVHDLKTLGGILAQAAGDQSLVIGRDNHYKLEGVYDAKIQNLASSTTVEGITSCLALALSEYEVSRSRADAIANLKDGATPKRAGAGAFARKNSQSQLPASSFFASSSFNKKAEPNPRHPQQTLEPVETGESSLDGAPSSSSSISITRLRFTVVSIFALREAVRMKLDPYNTYLARSLMAFSGRAVVGEGLEGCSRETLDFLVAYNPDATLLLDSTALYNGLKRGNWRRCPIGQVMVASLAAAATTPITPTSQNYTLTTEQSVMQALSVLPKAQRFDWPSFVFGFPPVAGQFATKYLENDHFPQIVLHLQRVSVVLFSMNYFVAHPTANTFVKAVGAQSAYSAAVIGVTNVGAIMVAAVHCFLMSKQPHPGNHLLIGFGFFRRMLLLATSLAFIGNVVCAVAIQQGSIPLAILGRFLIGMSSAELIHRQLISKCLPSILVVSESACYVQCQVLGRILGIAIGALAECVPVYIRGVGVRALQSSSWLMAFLWLVHGLRILLEFREKDNAGQRGAAFVAQELENQLSKEEDSSNESSSDNDDGNGAAGIMRSSSRNSREEVTGTSSKQEDGRDVEFGRKSASGTDLSVLRIRILADSTLRKRKHPFKTILIRAGKVLTYKVAIPVAMVIVVCTAFTQEILFTSCAIVTDQYFSWSGETAGIFMGGLMILFLPIDYFCEQISRRFEERTVIKRTVTIFGFGLLMMINWSAIISVVVNFRRALSQSLAPGHHQYDWRIGIFQYTLGFLVSYSGLVALEGATLSLLSKVSLAASKNPLLNIATLVTFFSLIARSIGDIQILLVGLSHHAVNNDIINSLVIPMLGVCLVVGVLIRRHYFFLM